MGNILNIETPEVDFNPPDISDLQDSTTQHEQPTIQDENTEGQTAKTLQETTPEPQGTPQGATQGETVGTGPGLLTPTEQEYIRMQIAKTRPFSLW